MNVKPLAAAVALLAPFLPPHHSPCKREHVRTVGKTIVLSHDQFLRSMRGQWMSYELARLQSKRELLSLQSAPPKRSVLLNEVSRKIWMTTADPEGEQVNVRELDLQGRFVGNVRKEHWRYLGFLGDKDDWMKSGDVVAARATCGL